LSLGHAFVGRCNKAFGDFQKELRTRRLRRRVTKHLWNELKSWKQSSKWMKKTQKLFWNGI